MSGGAISGGEEDTAGRLSFTVGIVGTSGTMESTTLCSGTLIAPNLVLTARHCVSEFEQGGDCRTASFSDETGNLRFWVTTATRLGAADAPYRTVAQFVAPANARVCGADIGLLLLEENIPESEARPARPLVQPLERSAMAKDRITVVGFGKNSDEGGSGIRRLAEDANLKCLVTPASRCSPGPAYGDNEFIASARVCKGDSGGSAFAQSTLVSGEPVVLGVTVRTTERGCSDGVFTRTDRFASFLVENARVAADIGNYPVPAWARETPPKEAPTPPEEDSTPPDPTDPTKAPPEDDGGIVSPDAGTATEEAGTSPPEPGTSPSDTTPNDDDDDDRGLNGSTNAGDREPSDRNDTRDNREDDDEETTKPKSDSGGCSASPGAPSGDLAPVLLAIGALLQRARRRGGPRGNSVE